ncbi:MAG TPA: potassium transporter KefB [Flavobacterium sp.]|jgi:hypothetical protein
MKTEHSTTESNQPLAIAKPVLIGAVIGLIAISFFVFGIDNPNPEWGNLWIIRPLIITPLAGATGGAFYYFMDRQSSKGLNKTVAVILSLVVFIIGLWMGIVLGLAGTMWD